MELQFDEKWTNYFEISFYFRLSDWLKFAIFLPEKQDNFTLNFVNNDIFVNDALKHLY